MKQKARHSGFTLAEIAVVLAIIGIAMTMGLKMLTATLENSAYSETRAKQERIKLALIGYLRTNGKLPCPDTDPAADGAENAPCVATAAAGYGVVPWLTLQLPREAAIDGWGNFFSYRVANFVAPVVKNWTSKLPAGTAFDINELTTSNVALTIRERSSPSAVLTTITDKSVVVILSHGKNGLAALTTRGVARIPPPTALIALDENTNGTVTSNIFVRRVFNDSAQTPVGGTNPGGPFDDVVAYMTPQELLQPLLTEQTLFGCQHYCGLAASGCGATGIPIGAATATCP
jgi:prepilin-type N-terminal cleavage/methylation domain-containing protein